MNVGGDPQDSSDSEEAPPTSGPFRDGDDPSDDPELSVSAIGSELSSVTDGPAHPGVDPGLGSGGVSLPPQPAVIVDPQTHCRPASPLSGTEAVLPHRHRSGGSRGELRTRVAVAAVIVAAGVALAGLVALPTSDPDRARADDVSEVTSDATQVPSTTAVAVTADTSTTTQPSPPPPELTLPAPQGELLSVADVVERAGPSVLAVRSVRPGGPSGSAVVVASGLAVTNSHVVTADREVMLHPGGSEAGVVATVVAANPAADLALLSFDSGLPAVPVADRALRLGEEVIVVGNALDLAGSLSVTRGIVSAEGRDVMVEDGKVLVGLVQTDAAINPGNSGGAILSMSGELVGIATAVAADAENVGFGVPGSQVTNFLDAYRSGDPSVTPLFDRAWLGVFTGPARGVDGVAVTGVEPGSPADVAGIVAGDVLVAVDSAVLASPADLSSVLAPLRPGDTATISVVRPGLSAERFDVHVTFAARPS